jgi:peptide/nickel transport system ATP-binding protein
MSETVSVDMAAPRAAADGEPVLEVSGLKTHFFTKAGVIKAVDGVSFSVARGEILGLVGESGSGKSITGFSVLGLVDPPGRIIAGEVRFNGRDLRGLREEELRTLRGDRIAMIFQDPMMTLNPVLRVDTQMIETIEAHRSLSRSEAREIAREGLARVGIPSPGERLSSYPHQLSGGMRQRVAIAIAFLNSPDLIIADEPTTALDVTIQSQILAQAQALCRATGTAMIWITHDLAVVAGLAQRIAVMYAGRIVESGPTDDVLDRPLHPYTVGLLDSVPSANERGARLRQIAGAPPDVLRLGAECAFLARCPRATDACRFAPEETRPAQGRTLRCHNPARRSNAQ